MLHVFNYLLDLLFSRPNRNSTLNYVIFLLLSVINNYVFKTVCVNWYYSVTLVIVEVHLTVTMRILTSINVNINCVVLQMQCLTGYQ